MRINERYYSGKDVQRILGITEPALRNLVNQKKIKKVIPPGRTNGLYLRHEIDRFAEQWEAFIMAKEPPPQTSFEIPDMDDMEDENELDRRTVGGAGMTAEVRKSWLNVNPSLDYHVRHNGKLVAFIRLLPLKHDILENFMEGKVRGKDIPTSAIETFEIGKPIECLVIGIASDPDVDEETRTHYVLTLLRGTMRELEKLGEQGIIISKIYATSESPTGIAMAVHLGMEQIPGKIGRRVKFVLNIDNSDSLLASRYKRGLDKWKRQNKSKSKNALSSDSRMLAQ